jgi:carbonic anhydrase
VQSSLSKILHGYHAFRRKYAEGDNSIMQSLSVKGQKPEIMVVACCDSRVDPALILQCDPGDLFVVRNVANIVPPFEKDENHHGTSAALEFGVCVLQVKHLILLGHSQCGGIQHLLNSEDDAGQNDFISSWVSIIKAEASDRQEGDIDTKTARLAKKALDQSKQNCMTFPWIRERVSAGQLAIHLWFFDIKSGQILTHSAVHEEYHPLKQ